MRRIDPSPSAGRMSRRRFLSIAGCAAGTALLPGVPHAAWPLHRWRGVALGAAASIQLVHPDRARAERLIATCVAEVRRLERIFSLYDDASTLAALNRDGAVEMPPLEMVELLGRARRFSEITNGTFDVTIQPLWARYAQHFAAPDADPNGPAISDVLRLVDWRRVSVTPDRIAFDQTGMAVTLNGIAQGFITDRVAALLKRGGVERVLVDLGEISAVGRHPAGRPWRAGIDDPRSSGTLAGRLDLDDRALATSGGYGTVFDTGARVGHLIDPRTGRTAPVARSVSVLAETATTADALSTAFALMSEDEIIATQARFDGVETYIAGVDSWKPGSEQHTTLRRVGAS